MVHHLVPRVLSQPRRDVGAQPAARFESILWASENFLFSLRLGSIPDQKCLNRLKGDTAFRGGKTFRSGDSGGIVCLFSWEVKGEILGFPTEQCLDRHVMIPRVTFLRLLVGDKESQARTPLCNIPDRHTRFQSARVSANNPTA
jgi:hypothetical protein